MKLLDIIQKFEERIPLTLQETWDTGGLTLGDWQNSVKRVFFAYDLCNQVVREAIKNKCQLIVTHHPVRLKGSVELTSNNYEQNLLLKCAENKMAVYVCHTAHDNSKESLSRAYLQQWGCKNIAPILPQLNMVYKLVVFVPQKHTKKLREALFLAGAGKIGAYGECSFTNTGVGTFKGDVGTRPFLGKAQSLEFIKEDRLETIVKSADLNGVLMAMKQTHPYEEVAYDVIPLQNKTSETGSGAVGVLSMPILFKEFLKIVQVTFNSASLRVVTKSYQKKISRVAICTGSGSSLLSEVIKNQCDVFVTGDVKYHGGVEALRHDVALIDVGHFASEIASVTHLKNLFVKLFGKKLLYIVCESLQDVFTTYDAPHSIHNS